MPITAQDHIRQSGYDDEWLLILGEAIEQILGVDAAVAASRAMDLARHPALAKAVGDFVSGWLGISQAYQAGQLNLTPNQDDTLKRALKKMVADIDQLVTLPTPKGGGF
jgi:hypothetical protein